MKTIKNTLITLKIDNHRSDIIHDGTVVGYISYQDELDIYIDTQYRGRHFATNALYLFNQYLHDTLKIDALRAYIPHDNDIARHVVEHSGYHIDKKDYDGTLYIHTKASTTKDDALTLNDNEECLYLAGGCFWGMERVFKVLDGVINTTTGYANGHLDNPSYEDIIRNDTGYRECVRVIYDKKKVTLETVLEAFFMCIDPTLKNQQGEDIGEQYQTGIYYRNPDLYERIKKVYDLKSQDYSDFYVELKPLDVFYEAEEYHQNYLDKHPDGYCHITRVDLERVKSLNK